MSHEKILDNDLKILRKLGPGELVIDYEIQIKNCILPFTLLFASNIDLFSFKEKIEHSIRQWKEMHTLLNSRIIILDPENQNDEKNFSRERYFALMDHNRMHSLENITYLRSSSQTGQNNKRLLELLHDRELNIEPVNSRQGPLWRLSFIELESARKYVLMLTIHHSIVDGRNAYAIMEQLLELIDKNIQNRPVDVKKYEIMESIEQKLFNNEPEIMNKVNLKPEYEVSAECKIPDEFAPTNSASSSCLNDSKAIEFVYLFDKSQQTPLHLNTNKEFDKVTEFTSFTFDKIDKLLEKCHKSHAKLTGCLNLVCALATFDLYKSIGIDESFYKKICYHYMINLRPFLNIDNLTMGYWPVVQNGIFSTSDKVIDLNSDEWYKNEFWSLAKHESDLIHLRIDQNEHIEWAKLDFHLLDLIDEHFVFAQGGSVHFGLSNLGHFVSPNYTNFQIEEFYYNESTISNQCTAIIFHGLSTINNTLCWSLGYNCKSIEKKFIEYLCKCIKKILYKASQEN